MGPYSCSQNPVSSLLIPLFWATLNVNFIGGSVTLASSNPFEYPNIDLGLLNSDFDLYALKEGLKGLQRLFSAPTWEEYQLTLGIPYPDDEEGQNTFIRSVADSGGHQVGTCAMSPKGADYGVVDPDLRLKKASGLRIVDASVMVGSIGSSTPNRS